MSSNPLDEDDAKQPQGSHCDSASEPGRPNVWCELARMAARSNDFPLALMLIERAIEGDPRVASYKAVRGAILARLQRPGEALAAYDDALRLAPDLAEVHLNRGVILRDKGRLEEALAAYNEALRLRPDLAEAHVNRGNTLLSMGQPEEALAAYDKALRLRPNSASVHLNRGVILKGLGRWDDALAAYDEALRLRPDHAEAHLNRGNLMMRLGHPRSALAAFDEVLRLRPELAQAQLNRGNALMSIGRLGEALAAYGEALRLRPDYTEAHSNYLFCLNFDPSQDDVALFEAHRRWGARFGRSPHRRTMLRDAASERILRVGLVSPDFGRHPIGYFTESTLAALDRNAVQLHCYSGRPSEDDVTARIKAEAAVWRSTIGLTDDELTAAIIADGIDILIDLAGHTAASRIGCFASRPAPVLVHWAGSTHTIPAVDYSLWDWIHVPHGDERWFVETVVRLPEVRMCYTPPIYAPEMAEPPGLARGRITFGSFNSLAKINMGVFDVWTRVLAAVQDSRLMLNWRDLADAGERERLTALFKAGGIEAERLELRPGEPTHAGVLGEYNDVDIALDTFPFSGCTTTCEALWMGVPVVSLPQTRPVSRQSQAFLTALGRTEWVAKNADDFIRIATSLAADPDRLALLRRAQRTRMRESPVCDARRFARHMEAALRGMWRSWCVSPQGQWRPTHTSADG
jgi:protein O-GlcNAc transferase